MENFFNPANDWQWNIYDLIPDMYQHLKLFAFFSRGEYSCHDNIGTLLWP